MIYITGTGRCGTTTIAHRLGGEHEPKPNIIVEAYDYYRGDFSSLQTLTKKLKTRAALNTPCISDNKQSLVIPLLRQIDPDGHFVVLFREPKASIRSFLGKHWYKRKSIWETNRLRPWQGFPPKWTRVMKCGWLWRETYRRILSTLGDAGFELIETSELGGVALNANNQNPALECNEREQSFLDSYIMPFYAELQSLRGQQAPGLVRRQLNIN